MRLSLLLSSALFLTAALAAQAQTTSDKPDRATLLWLQTIRQHPELAPLGSSMGRTQVQDRYDQILKQRLGIADTKASANLPDASLSGPLEIPVPDSLVALPVDLPTADLKNIPKTLEKIPGKVITRTGKITPYELCVRDGGCDGLK